MRQIALPIDALRPDKTGSLIVTSCNAAIVETLANSANWPSRCAILTGPARSGKSLLASYFAGKGGGLILDKAESLPDEAVFNAWNRVQEEKSALLLISRFAPANCRRGRGQPRHRLTGVAWPSRHPA